MRIGLTCNNYPPEFYGGTERFVQALARGLVAAGDDVVVIAGTEQPRPDLSSDDRSLEPHVVEHDGDIPVVRLPLRADEKYGLNVPRPRIQKLLADLIDRYQIDLLHVNHWSHLTDRQVRLAAQLGRGCVVTLHDMWTSCVRFFRLPPAGITCPEGSDRSACIDCANLEYKESSDVVLGWMHRRDADIGAELVAAHTIVAPSADCARACVEHREWPDGAPDIEVLPHGLIDASPPPARGPLGLPLRVGTFGNLNREKGVFDLIDAMDGVRAELHLFGAAAEGFREQVMQRAAELTVNLTWHGAYDESVEHPALQLDLAVFPSRCRETYGLVVDEALHHGTPVVVSAVGALPERVLRGGGLTVPAGQPVELAAAIRGLVDDREKYQLLRVSIPTDFPTMDDTVARYRHIYSKAWATAQATR